MMKRYVGLILGLALLTGCSAAGSGSSPEVTAAEEEARTEAGTEPQSGAETVSAAPEEKQKTSDYTFEELYDRTYAVSSRDGLLGYLFVGEKSALSVSLSGEEIDFGSAGYTDGRDMVLASVETDSLDEYDLGDRTIRGIELSGESVMLGIKFPVEELDITTQWGYLDEANSAAFTNLIIGTDYYYVGGNDNIYGGSGRAYYNLLDYQENVRKVKLLSDAAGGAAVYDGNGDLVSSAYIADMDTLVENVTTFSDKTAVYEFDMSMPCANYITTNGSATLEFHNETNGFLGYWLRGAGVADKTLIDQHYFAIDYNDGEFYIMRDTDVHTAYLYINDEEAFMIDCGQFAGIELWERTKNLIGDRPLSIFITHAHGDHWFNLQEFDYDQLKYVYIGENEVPTRVGENTGVYSLAEEFEGNLKDKLRYWKDGEVINIAGKDFEFVQMTGHTPYGGGLIDLDGRHFFSGDQLGTQSYLGGAGTKASTLDDWINGVDKLKARLEEDQPVDDIFMAHMPFAIDVSYVDSISLVLHSIRETPEESIVYQGDRQLVVAKGMDILSQDEFDALFTSGTTDLEASEYASASFTDDTK